MANFLQFTFSGLTLGAVLALLALGWVVIYKVSGVLNLAQGAFLVIGALASSSLYNAGWNLFLAALVAVLLAVAAALALDLLALRRARPGIAAAPVIITLGAAEILAELSRQAWGNDPLRMSSFLSREPIMVFGAALQQHTLLLWAGTGLLLLGMWSLFERTLLGKALQACAEDAEGARLVGISPTNMRTLAFALAAAIGAIGGVLMAPIIAVTWSDGIMLGIQGFIGAVLGGWSYPGAILGGLLLGLTENYSAAYVSSDWKDFITISVLLVILLVRPQGLIVLRNDITGEGRRSRRRTGSESATRPTDRVATPSGNRPNTNSREDKG